MPKPKSGSSVPTGSLDGDRAAALKFLQKKIPGAFRDPNEAPALVGVSSGSIAVDMILGNGGFPRARLSEVFGVPSSGKSTLMAMACAKAQRMGLYPVYIDLERGLDRVYAERIGFDVEAALRGERGLYLTPETAEETFLIVEQMALQGAADLVIVDSVAAMTPKSLFEADIDSSSAIGVQSRLLAALLPKVTKIIDRPGSKTALVFVNQVRANINTGPARPGTSTTKGHGGWALHHFSSLRVELKQIDKKAKVVERPSLTDPSKTDKVPVASRHSAYTLKNKVAEPYRTVEFYIRYDPDAQVWGIDNLQTLMDVAATKGIIDAKGGGNYVYHGQAGDQQIRGEDALYAWFLAEEGRIRELRDAVGA